MATHFSTSRPVQCLCRAERRQSPDVTFGNDRSVLVGYLMGAVTL